MFLERLLVLGLFDIKHLATAFSLMERFVRAVRTADLDIELCNYRTFSVALYIAQKFLDDEEIWMVEDFGKICGIEPADLVVMEAAFCQKVNFEVAVAQDTFVETMNELYSIEPLLLSKYNVTETST